MQTDRRLLVCDFAPMDTDAQRERQRSMVKEMMLASGLDRTGLARAAGLAPSTLTRFMEGEVEHLLTARTLSKLDEALARLGIIRTPHHGAPSYSAPHTPLPNTRASRFKAARWASWEEPEVAAIELDFPLNQLLAIEAGGDAPIDPAAVMKLCLVGYATPGWIERGDMTGMDPAATARIGTYAPELVPPRPKPAAKGGGPAGLAGGDAKARPL